MKIYITIIMILLKSSSTYQVIKNKIKQRHNSQLRRWWCENSQPAKNKAVNRTRYYFQIKTYDCKIQIFKMPKLIKQKEQSSKAFSFKQRTKQRLIDQFKRITQEYQVSKVVLVLDLPSAFIINRLFSTTELIEWKIMFVERLEVVRKVLAYHALYFITPSKQSITALLNDFKDESNPQYKRAHVLLTDSLEEALLKLVSTSKSFIKKLARHSFKQFFCQVTIDADNVVEMELPYLQLTYSVQSPQQRYVRSQIAKKFVHLIAAYSTVHTVRLIFDKESANKVGQRIVEKCSKDIKSYLLRLLQCGSLAIDPKAQDITILIVDRSIDVITPLIHGYSYQSLLYDILNQSEKSKQSFRNLPKDIFEQFRYRHISHALQELPLRLNMMIQKTKGQKYDPLELKSLIEDKQNLNVHVQLLHRLFGNYKDKKLNQIGELELEMATGITSDGRETKSSELINKVIFEIKNNKILSKYQLLRLALLLIICIKLTKQDYLSICSLFDQQQKKVLTNIIAMGITYQKKISKSTKRIAKQTMEQARQLLQQRSIPSDRFESALQITIPGLTSLLSKSLDKLPSKLAEVVVSVSTEENIKRKFNQQKFIVFMAGGLTRTQISHVRKNHELDSILLATDQILTPSQFVSAVQKINILSQ